MKKSNHNAGLSPLSYIITKLISLSILLIFLSIGSVNAIPQKLDELCVMLDNTMPGLLSKHSVPGASISYISDGKIIYSAGYGVKSVFRHSKTNSNTIYEAGSIGKMLTAYICLKLEDEGSLNIDKPVADYITDPWIRDDNWSKKITVRQLLSHTSGLSNSFEIIKDKKVHFEPGTKYSYSGVGYIYLQKIIENITSRPFEEVAKQYVFIPFNMHSSSFVRPDKFYANSASPHLNIRSVFIYTLVPFLLIFGCIYIIGFGIGLMSGFRYYSGLNLFIGSLLIGFLAVITLFYTMNISKLILPLFLISLLCTSITLAIKAIIKNVYFSSGIAAFLVIMLAFVLKIPAPIGNDIFPTRANPAFSLKSTSDDIIRFSSGIMNEFYNENSSIKDLFNEQVKVDESNGWGLGVGIDRKNEVLTYWHSGINPGFQSLVVMDLKNRNGMAILTNSDTGLDCAKEIVRLTLSIDGDWNIRR